MLEWIFCLRTISFMVLVLCTQVLTGQPNPQDSLVAAGALRDRGEYNQAIAVLEALTQSGAEDANSGTAWTLLGSVYQDVGRYGDAQRAFQTAISVFKNQPGKERQEAIALDNLGSLYLAIGQTEMSKKLRLRVLKVVQAAGDHAGIAMVYNNLAATALQGNDIKQTRKYVSLALQEIRLAPQTEDDDLAAIFTHAGWLSIHDHDYKRALAYYDDARRLWVKQHGMNHHLTGWGNVLCGWAHARMGDTQQGLAEVKTGLGIIENTVGTRVSVYFGARLIYAEVLSAAGSPKEGKAMRAATLLSLQSFLRGKASESVISADAFR
jgi:tetratricopeptide (TPR) repeat protein